eukprot:m.326970 g.326970  ORF g.326970 m.326970 type:complete len:119 (+) comp16490_c0_seq1:519-875(+)
MCLEVGDFFKCEANRCIMVSDPSGVPQLTPTEGQTVIGYPGLRQLYVLFDRENDQVGFAKRSGECAVPCSAFLSQWTCSVNAQCGWSNGACSGTQPAATIDTPSGATVWPGSCASPPS